MPCVWRLLDCKQRGAKRQGANQPAQCEPSLAWNQLPKYFQLHTAFYILDNDSLVKMPFWGPVQGGGCSQSSVVGIKSSNQASHHHRIIESSSSTASWSWSSTSSWWSSASSTSAWNVHHSSVAFSWVIADTELNHAIGHNQNNDGGINCHHHWLEMIGQLQLNISTSSGQMIHFSAWWNNSQKKMRLDWVRSPDSTLVKWYQTLGDWQCLEENVKLHNSRWEDQRQPSYHSS